MRRIACLVSFCLALAAAAGGDVIYLRNGKTYQGKVTRRGDKAWIETSLGTIEVDASEVLHVEAASQPAAGDTRPADAAPAGTQPSKHPAGADSDLPEPIAFLFMSNLPTTPVGTASFELRRQIDQWRAYAHDRRRKAGLEWLGPEDFLRHRTAYLEYLREAEESARKALSYSGESAAERSNRLRYGMAAVAKFRQAAASWADPPLRSFLCGVAELRAADPAKAETFFRQSLSPAPRVAAFHQGLGLAMAGAGRHSDALGEFLQALRLQPDSPDPARLLQEAMQRVPGAETGRPGFQAARNVLGQYELPAPTRTDKPMSWLLPGKPVAAPDHTLPTPAFDRLLFRQAVGVPVGPSMLLVDAAAVGNALELFVRVDERTLIPARAVRTTGSSTAGRASSPLGLVAVDDCRFTPLQGPADAPVTTGQRVTILGLSLYEQLGTTVRQVPAKMISAGSGPAAPSAELSPGDAAGPVLAEDGRLLGFLAGKTDVSVDGGGRHRFLPLSEAAGLLKVAERSPPSYSSARRIRKTDPQPVEGRFFIVHVTVGETFKKP